MRPKEEIAWAAGFFDGEGNVVFHVDARGRTSYWLVVETGNEAAVRRLEKLFGGNVSYFIRQGRNERHRWFLKGSQSVEAAKELKRYSVVKREQLEHYIEAVKALKDYGGTGQKMPQREVEKRQRYAREIQALKAGIPKNFVRCLNAEHCGSGQVK